MLRRYADNVIVISCEATIMSYGWKDNLFVLDEFQIYRLQMRKFAFELVHITQFEVSTPFTDE